MIKTILSIPFIIGFIGNNILLAQPNEIQPKGIWGQPACGLQISIAVSNYVIETASNFTLTIKLKNVSTNVIESGESSPENDFKVLLTSESGKAYQLTPSAPFETRLLRMKLKPGEIRTWPLALSANRCYEPPGFNPTFKNIPSGKYVLKATRKFLPCEIESNPLEIQIE